MTAELVRAEMVVEHSWISLADGTRLSALVRRPADDQARPAILEYLPYRKDDGTRARDNMNHVFFAEQGFASVRVDIRGSGDSGGILEGEYLAAELDDGVAVIEWIATQPWCDENVGMMGISWGGFNALQIAAKRPRALKAIVSVASTVDRYADDVHYRGGCVLGTDMLAWAATMLCFNARPPSPSVAGDDWLEQWIDRLERTPPFIDSWLAHQRRDDFWKHGSICEDYSAIECPVLIVAGFADGYTDTVFKALAGLNAPVRGIVGPWSHNYPNVGVPGPNIGFLEEVIRWFDEHLRGTTPDPVDSEALRAWMQEWVEPADFYANRPGRWVAEPSWPSPRIDMVAHWLDGATLAPTPGDAVEVVGQNDAAYGAHAGTWWGYAQPGSMASDQRLERPAAFAFIGAPAPEPTEILGMPRLSVEVACDAPNAILSARLCDVAPDGAELLVSRGFLNLAHRDSHESPTPLEPGKFYEVAFDLDAAAHRLDPGHRWALHIGLGLWPLAWPTPHRTALTLRLGEQSRLDLPSRPPHVDDGVVRDLGRPTASPSRVTVRGAPTFERTIETDPVSGLLVITETATSGRIRVNETATEFESADVDMWTIHPDDPCSPLATAERRWQVHWGSTVAAVATASRLWADATSWYSTSQVAATLDGTEIFAREYSFEVARDLT